VAYGCFVGTEHVQLFMGTLKLRVLTKKTLWYYVIVLWTSASLPPGDWVGIWVQSTAPANPPISWNLCFV